MADASHPFDARRRRPRDWGDAFANLPLETPPLSVWAQIEARLSASSEAPTDASTETYANVVELPKPAIATNPRSASQRRTFSVRSWLALAASLCALALLPLLWRSNTDEASDSPTIVASASTVSNTTAATTAKRDERAFASQPAEASLKRIAPTTNAAVSTTATDHATTPLDVARIALDTAPQLASATSLVPAPTAPLQMPSNPPSTESTTPDAVEIASIEPERLPANAVLVGEADADATHREMEMLYSASAQLETLLTYAQDSRVETGPAAALSSQIHTRLAKIDARLALPGLSTDEQYALWQARVGTLRQAVALESEQRALSVEGQGLEGTLVEVY